MHIIIIGAGVVGQTLAENLDNSHEIVVIDQDEDLVKTISYELDVLTISGDGTKLSVLREAGIEDADRVIACTGDEQTNIVACGTAKTASEVFTIARVKRRDLLETWKEKKEAYNVDHMVCSDLLAAEAIFQIAGLPGALDTDTFGDGVVRMAEFKVASESPFVHRSVAEIDEKNSLTIAAISRDGDDFIIPDGDTEINADDRVIVIGPPEKIRATTEQITGSDVTLPDEVVLIGGTEVGFHAAQIFNDHGYKTRLVEQNEQRARQIAEDLPDTTVMQHDATDIDFLEREHIGEADLVVSALTSDEKNLLAALLSERMGAARTVSLVHQPAYSRLFETVGIDAAVSTQEETAEAVTRFTRQEDTEKVSMIGSQDGEVIEVKIDDESEFVGVDIDTMTDKLKNRVVIGSIIRDGKPVTPRGETTVKVDDHIVIFTKTEYVDAILKKI